MNPKEFLLYYNTSQTQYVVPAQVILDKNCNGYTVLNIGTTVAFCNGIPLNPGVPGTNNGESWSVGGNRGEILAGRLDIGFTGGAGRVVVIQKFYIPEINLPKTFNE